MGKMILEFFPDSYIRLNQEISNHPDLVALLVNHPANEFEVRLAQIASYCDVILDGYYMPSELEVIAERLYEKLLLKRGDKLVLTSSNFH